MESGSPRPFATRSVTKLLAAVSGNGMLSFSKTLFLDHPLTGVHSPYKANPAYKGKWYAPLIDNPAYKGEWAPRKIPNPAYFEDLNPVKSLINIGGIGIELWTMTPSILFDNIYVGHSEEEAKALAAETFDVKKPLEEALDKVAGKVDEEEEEEQLTFKEDPMSFIRQKIFSFVEVAKVDPVLAFRTQPETGSALLVSVFTLAGMLLSVVGIIGGQQKPVSKVCSFYFLSQSKCRLNTFIAY